VKLGITDGSAHGTAAWGILTEAQASELVDELKTPLAQGGE
jgi:hypothetical protein